MAAPMDLEKLIGGLTYGDGGVSVPIFIANYFMDVMKDLALVGIVVLLLVFAWDVLTEGGRFVDSLRRHGSRVLLVAVVAILMFSVKGPHTYNGKKTYTIIDLYASIFRMGENLADALAYAILYGGAYGNGAKPTDSSPTINFFDEYGVKKIIDSIKAEEKMAMIKEAEETLKQSESLIKVAKSPSVLPWKELAKRTAAIPDALGFSVKAAYGSPPKIEYGYFGIKGYERKYLFPYNPSIPFRKAFLLQAGGSYSGGSKPPALKPPTSLLADVVYASSAVLSDLSASIGAIDLSKFSPDAKQKILDEKKMFEEMAGALDELAKSSAAGKPPSQRYLDAMSSMRKKYGDLPQFASLEPYVSALASGLGANASELESRSKPVKTPDGNTEVYPWNVTALSSLAEKYKTLTKNWFYGFSRGIANIPRASNSIVDAFLFRKPIVFASIISGAPNAGISPELYGQKISSALSGAAAHADAEIEKVIQDMRKSYTAMKNGLAQTDTPFGKSLAQLYDENPKNMTVTWHNLGFFYAALKAHYTRSVVFNTYALALDAVGNAERKKSEAVAAALSDAEKRAAGAASFTDAEKTDKFAETIGTVVGIAGVFKGLGEGFLMDTKDLTSPKGLLKLFGKPIQMAKGALGALEGAAKGAGYMLIAKIFFTVIYVYVPALLWMMAVLAWYLRTSIMVATFPIVTFMAFFKRKSDVLITAAFQAVGQAVVPFVMVSIFFIVITFSIVIENTLDYFMPLYDFGFLAGGSWIGSAIDSLDSVSGNHMFGWFMDAVRSLIMIFINTQLMLQFFRADDYVSDFIGARISYGSAMAPESVMSKMRVNV